MAATQSWWKRFLGGAENEKPALIRSGVIRQYGRWELCSPDADVKGVKIVYVSSGFASEQAAVFGAFDAYQRVLASAPKSLRPRKRKLKVVSLPPNPEPEYAAAIEGTA